MFDSSSSATAQDKHYFTINLFNLFRPVTIQYFAGFVRHDHVFHGGEEKRFDESCCGDKL